MFFVVPFISIYLFYLTNVETSVIKDLSRIGKMKLEYDFFENNLDRQLKNVNIEYHGLSQQTDYEILNIGDSFSRQEMKGTNGYLNYLGKKYKILNMPFTNPLQRLEALLTNNFFDNTSFKYVILEMVERNSLINLNFKTNFQEKVDFKFKDSTMYEKFRKQFKTLNKVSFFSKTPLKFTYNKIIGRVDNKVQKVNTKRPLFSYPFNELYFYYKDVENLDKKNSLIEIQELNKKLNNYAGILEEKGLKLIVLICPVKYHFYYNEIKSPNYPKSILFDVLDTLESNYTFLNSKKKLSQYITLKSDLYFLDDTHWSPIASEIIANELDEYISGF